MNKEKELAKHLKDRIVLIGTSIKQMEIIAKYAKANQRFGDAFALLYISLQNFVFIELYKLFDTNGKDVKQNNIYALTESIEDNNKTIHKELSKFSDLIDYIVQQRNHYYAHDTGKKVIEIYNEKKLNSINELLKVLAEICCKANDELFLSICVSNANDFDRWCFRANSAIEEVCSLNDRIHSHDISKEYFLSNIDDYIVFLKDKQEKKL